MTKILSAGVAKPRRTPTYRRSLRGKLADLSAYAYAGVVKLVNTLTSGVSAERFGGSNPPPGTDIGRWARPVQGRVLLRRDGSSNLPPSTSC